jgi:hypothetical protein
MAVQDAASAYSLDLLEARLHRIQYAIRGKTDTDDELSSPNNANGPAVTRLRNLEHRLNLLASRSTAVRDVLRLQAKHPEIFADSQTALDLPQDALVALVLSHTQLYQRLSAQLTTLQATSVPDPAPLAKLLELQPRIQKAALRQESQARELAELRMRSAAVVEKWYESGVLGMGQKWTEWEESMRDMEILVRRMEVAKKKDEGLI